MKRLATALALLTFLFITNSVAAEILRWDWHADGSQVRNNPPPNGQTDSEATADGIVLYDTQTNLMTVRYTWRDLFGELTKLHIHGAATPEQNNAQHVIETFGPPDIPPGVNLRNDTWQETFELQTLSQTGFPDLSPAEIIEIMTDGLAYVNVHTSVFGTGEIRGNLGLPITVPEPASALLVLLCLTGGAACPRWWR